MSRKKSRQGHLVETFPNPMSVHVGSRIRLQRLVLDLTPDQLAEKLGATGSELEKYETGTVRIEASHLFELSNILGVPLGFFFAETSQPDQTAESRSNGRMNHAEIVELLGTFRRIPEDNTRVCILDFIRSLNPQPASETGFVHGANADSIFARLADLERRP